MPSRDLAEARLAYERGDRRSSARAHARPRTSSQGASGATVAGCEPGHEHFEDEFSICGVFGAFEGIALATVVIAATRASGMATGTVLSTTTACLLGMAVALFVRDYVRYRSYLEHYKHERDREKWELESFRDGEIKEMVELYESFGVSKEDAKIVMKTLSKYDKVFVDLMMDQELRLPRPKGTPLRNAIATSVSFLVFGFATIAVYGGFDMIVASSWLSNIQAFQYDFIKRLLPVTPAIAVAWLTGVWMTIFWSAVKLHVLEHRPRAWWTNLLVVATCFTIAYIAVGAMHIVHDPFVSIYTAWAPLVTQRVDGAVTSLASLVYHTSV